MDEVGTGASQRKLAAPVRTNSKQSVDYVGVFPLIDTGGGSGGFGRS